MEARGRCNEKRDKINEGCSYSTCCRVLQYNIFISLLLGDNTKFKLLKKEYNNKSVVAL